MAEGKKPAVWGEDGGARFEDGVDVWVGEGYGRGWHEILVHEIAIVGVASDFGLNGTQGGFEVLTGGAWCGYGGYERSCPSHGVIIVIVIVRGGVVRWWADDAGEEVDVGFVCL